MSLLNVRELQPFVVADVRPTGRVLGEGSYGSVEEAEIPGATCVIKKLHEALLPPPTEAHGADRMANTFVAECRLMSTVRHPHIVQFLGVCFLPGSRLPALIMEKLLTDLHNLLENTPNIPLSMKYAILVGVAKGLVYLHSRDPPVIHRDLSARNVLLNSAMVAKIADLGNSRIINVRLSQLMTMTKNPGNMCYMPPEAQEDTSRYNTSIDIFSFGNLTLFTLTQQFPTVKAAAQTDPTSGRVIGLTEIQRREESFNQVYLELGRDHPLVRLTEQCLQNLPNRRPPIAEVLRRLEEVVPNPFSDLRKLELMILHERGMQQEQELQIQIAKLQRDNLTQQAEIETHKDQITTQQVQLEAKELQVRSAHSQIMAQQYQTQQQLQQKDRLLHSMQQGYEAQLQDRKARLQAMMREKENELRRIQMEHKKVVKHQQTQLGSLEIQLRHLQSQVDLHKEKIPWTRLQRRFVKGSKEGQATAELFRTFQGILNKLTRQKFQTLAEQALELNIDNEERLLGCINMLITNVLKGPKYCQAFANLAKVLSPIEVDWTDADGVPRSTNFRRMLLNKCQLDFEKGHDESWLVRTAKEELPETKMDGRLAVVEIWGRKHSVANILFIGEMFKLKMLSEIIVHHCIVILLRSSSNEQSLECFARFMTITGKDLDHPGAIVGTCNKDLDHPGAMVGTCNKDLDHPGAMARMDKYFDRIADIIKRAKISAPIKFMLQDVQELRKNDWVPRSNIIETIDQLQGI